jgi:hypothetical protein
MRQFDPLLTFTINAVRAESARKPPYLKFGRSAQDDLPEVTHSVGWQGAYGFRIADLPSAFCAAGLRKETRTQLTV